MEPRRVEAAPRHEELHEARPQPVPQVKPKEELRDGHMAGDKKDEKKKDDAKPTKP